MKIKVKVIPNAKHPSIEQRGDEIVVKVDAPPIKGKANKRLIEILANHFGVKKSKIRILSGEHSREKIIEMQK